MKSMQWMHAGLSSIQIYKAHKQEGTKAATTLVSKGTQTRGTWHIICASSQAYLHQWLH